MTTPTIPTIPTIPTLEDVLNELKPQHDVLLVNNAGQQFTPTRVMELWLAAYAVDGEHPANVLVNYDGETIREIDYRGYIKTGDYLYKVRRIAPVGATEEDVDHVTVVLPDPTSGMDTAGMNIAESQRRAMDLIIGAIEKEHPWAEVDITLDLSHGARLKVSHDMGAPEDYDQIVDDIKEVITFWLEKYDLWIIEAPRNAEELRQMVDTHQGVVAEVDAYMVAIGEGDPDTNYGGYGLSVSVGAMPPHASREFPTWDALIAHFEEGEVLGMRPLDFTWLPAEE